LARGQLLFANVVFHRRVDVGNWDLSEEATELGEINAQVEIFVHDAVVKVFGTLVVLFVGRVAHLGVNTAKVGAEATVQTEFGSDLTSEVVVNIAEAKEIGALEGFRGQLVRVFANGNDVGGLAAFGIVHAKVRVHIAEVICTERERLDILRAVFVSGSRGPPDIAVSVFFFNSAHDDLKTVLVCSQSPAARGSTGSFVVSHSVRAKVHFLLIVVIIVPHEEEFA